jgi:SAM-dependent methyltransferase
MEYDAKRYWSGVAHDIDARPGSDVVAGDPDPLSRYRRRRFVSKFLSALPVEGRSVLEVGCGPGGNLVEIAPKRPRRLVGCDISSDMIRLASRRTSGIGGIELREVDGETLPFSDGEFELAYTVTVLQHNHDPNIRAVLHEMCRVTRDVLFLFEDTARRERAGYSWVLRPVSRYAEMCATHGFELTDATPLRVGASETLRLVVGRLTRTSAQPEGRPPSRLEVALQRVGLPVTRLLDRVVPQPRGLTRMVFHRR